jgi:hypothetical protein
MQNVKMEVQNDVLIIAVDMKAARTPSKSGETMVIASTKGNAKLPGLEQVRVGLNVFEYKPKGA